MAPIFLVESVVGISPSISDVDVVVDVNDATFFGNDGYERGATSPSSNKSIIVVVCFAMLEKILMI